MYRLVRLNVERVVNDEHARDILINQGYKLVEDNEQQSSTEEQTQNDTENQNQNDLNKLTVEQLKALAEERDIEVPSKIKKDDLVKMLEEVE